MKQQVIVIHGGNTFDTRKEYLTYLKKYRINYRRLIKGMWRSNLQKALGDRFEVAPLTMPNPMDAHYTEWKIMFRKLFPFLKGKPILVGHSLGGIFLAKFLSENRFPKKIFATFLIAAPYGNNKTRTVNESLADFILPKSLVRFKNQGGKIFLYQSKDDPIVPFFHLKKYQRALPKARSVIFKKRGHFGQEKFPELVNDIKHL